MDTLRNNLREINSLNQRGGRMLSIVDLIDDGTIDAPTAGYLLSCVSGGASFLTAAGPGGVGKTTLMACLLSFLPPGERIRTVTDPFRLPDPKQPTCYLCHEIGSGHWYGYLWGDGAAEFLALQRQGRIAGSLHAESVEELRQQLLGPSVGARERDLAGVELLLLMVREGRKRRVSAIYETAGSQHAEFTQTVRWDRGPDELAFIQPPGASEVATAGTIGLQEATTCIEGLVAGGTRMLEDVIREVADLYPR
ncbi:MAG: hypothetical protein U9R79_22075 [Armatimonadota bacterium]|nr:hypothetical protein [Armatimonadota bacterium]